MIISVAFGWSFSGILRSNDLADNWHIRDFRADDQAVVKALINQGLAQRFGKLNASMNPDLHDIQRHYVDKDAVFIVMEDTANDHAIIGCGALIHENGSDAIARIVRVSVHEELQGHGLGRVISQQLITRAREKGYRRILVETNDDWTSALKLYQALGFVEVSRTPVPEHSYTEVNMALNL